MRLRDWRGLGTLLLLAVAAFASASENANRLNELVEQWPKRDGAAAFELSLGISHCLVADDKVFFEVMNRQRATFGEWLAGIADETFVAWKPAQRPTLEKLRKDMLVAARRRSTDRQFGDLAKALASKLQTVKIRVVE